MNRVDYNMSFASNIYSGEQNILENNIFKIAKDLHLPITLLPVVLASNKGIGIEAYKSTEKLQEKELQIYDFTNNNKNMITGIIDDFRLFEPNIDEYYPKYFINAFGIPSNKHNTLIEEINRLKYCLYLMNNIGSKSLTISIGFFGENGLINDQVRDNRLKEISYNLLSLLKWAFDEGIQQIQFLIEPVMYYEKQTINKVEHALQVINYCTGNSEKYGLDSKWVDRTLGIALDLFHSTFHEDDPTLVEAILLGGKYVKSVHLSGSSRKPITCDYQFDINSARSEIKRKANSVQDMLKIIIALNKINFFEDRGELIFEWASWMEQEKWADLNYLEEVINESIDIFIALADSVRKPILVK